MKFSRVSVGNMVLVRTPDVVGKLSDLWDSPYEVIQKVSHVVCMSWQYHLDALSPW